MTVLFRIWILKKESRAGRLIRFRQDQVGLEPFFQSSANLTEIADGVACHPDTLEWLEAERSAQPAVLYKKQLRKNCPAMPWALRASGMTRPSLMKSCVTPR